MGCISSKQTKEDKPTPSEVPNLEEALEKLARDEEKLYGEIEDIERDLKEEQNETRKQSLRAKLSRKESVLQRVQRNRETVEKCSSAQTMKLNQIGRRASMRVREEVDRAMDINNRVGTLNRVQESEV
ncbi:uncharacterized protein LOC135351437 [Halichondria panicea]|uniref:uncharacterized protein LOC135351437 n=1 Tax=Halichondria panicea TaxID=6063 RepID=UPI00312B95EB